MLGFDTAVERLEFEKPVATDSNQKLADYIDALIPSAFALAEQKPRAVDLNRPDER